MNHANDQEIEKLRESLSLSLPFSLTLAISHPLNPIFFSFEIAFILTSLSFSLILSIYHSDLRIAEKEISEQVHKTC